MLTRIRDTGPILLIPAAWIAAAGSILGHLSEDGMIIAHGVMAIFIAFFAVTGWSAMAKGALRAWRLVLAFGLPVTVAGLAGFFVPEFETLLFSVSLIGWMLLPAAGLVYTARELPAGEYIYISCALLSVIGAAFAASGIAIEDEAFVLTGIAVVGLGQTVSIVDASWRDR